jgi:hypothetical protein
VYVVIVWCVSLCVSLCMCVCVCVCVCVLCLSVRVHMRVGEFSTVFLSSLQSLTSAHRHTDTLPSARSLNPLVDHFLCAEQHFTQLLRKMDETVVYEVMQRSRPGFVERTPPVHSQPPDKASDPSAPAPASGATGSSDAPAAAATATARSKSKSRIF